MELMTAGIIFVVRGVEMKLHKPARLDDNIIVRTTISKIRKS